MTARASPLMALTNFASLVIAGCAAAPPSPALLAAASQVETAILRAAGPGVSVNGKPADSGRALFSGDRIATGADTSALLEFPDGTTVQLDERSDEVTVSWSGDRLRLAFDDTALLVEKGGGFNIVQVVGKMASFFSWSAFVVVEEAPKSFDLDLFQGNAEFADPPGHTLAGGEFIEFGPSGMTDSGTIDKERARLICARFDRWQLKSKGEICARDHLEDPQQVWLGEAIIGAPALLPLIIGGALIFGGGGESTTTTNSAPNTLQ